MKRTMIYAAAVAFAASYHAAVQAGGGIYPPEPTADQSAPQKSRAEVVAELREAQRLGLVTVGGEGDVPQATPEQEKRIFLAGERARAAFEATVARK